MGCKVTTKKRYPQTLSVVFSIIANEKKCDFLFNF